MGESAGGLVRWRWVRRVIGGGDAMMRGVFGSIQSDGNTGVGVTRLDGMHAVVGEFGRWCCWCGQRGFRPMVRTN